MGCFFHSTFSSFSIISTYRLLHQNSLKEDTVLAITMTYHDEGIRGQLWNLFSSFTFTWVVGIKLRLWGIHDKCLYHEPSPWYLSFKLAQSIKYNNDGSRFSKIHSMNPIRHRTREELPQGQKDEEENDLPGSKCTDDLAPLLHHCWVVPPVSHHLLGCLPIRRCWEAPGAS